MKGIDEEGNRTDLYAVISTSEKDNPENTGKRISFTTFRVQLPVLF